MNILIKGYYGFGNFGDDILMIASYRMLKAKFPEANLFIFSNHNENLVGFRRGKGYNHYVFNLLDETPTIIDWTYFGEFDLLFDGGGGVYFDTRKGSGMYRLMNYLLGRLGISKVFMLDKFMRRVVRRPKRLRYKRRIGFGIGIGPYHSASRLLFSHLAEMGSYDTIVVRDRLSYSFLRNLKFSGDLHLGSDFTFLQKYWFPEDKIIVKSESFSRRIAVILLDRGFEKDELFEELDKLVADCASEEYYFRFLSLDENYDYKYRSHFFGRYPFVSWDPERMAISDFLEILGQHDIVISGRAHGAIIAAQLGVIPVCLGISQVITVLQ